jgi:hypothetical protein
VIGRHRNVESSMRSMAPCRREPSRKAQPRAEMLQAFTLAKAVDQNGHRVEQRRPGPRSARDSRVRRTERTSLGDRHSRRSLPRQHISDDVVSLFVRQPKCRHRQMQFGHKISQIGLVGIGFRSDLHEARRRDWWRQYVTAPRPAQLIRRDPMALGAPILGNPLPFPLCNLLIPGFSAFERGETA